MKTIFLLVFAALPCLLFSKAMSLKDALEHNVIKLTGSTNPENDNPLRDSHTGKCLRLQLQNTGNTATEIKIENAYRFKNETAAHQDLVTSESMLVVLKANESKQINMNALCCEKHDGAPAGEDKYVFMKKENSSIEKLCNLLEKQKNYGNTAQQAMWCLTDDNQLEDIYDTSPNIKIEDELVALIAKEKNIPIPKRQKAAVRILKYALEVEGRYSQWIDKPTTIGVYITDTLNNVLETLLPDDTETRKNGTVRYSYGYRGQFPKGKYLLQVKVNGEWKKEKEIYCGSE